MKRISLSRLKDLVRYDEHTGKFYWLNPNRGKARRGLEIKGWMSSKYLTVGLDMRRYYLHRLAWLYVYGYWPSQLDHINLNPLDNRICNLRKCNSSQNGANVKGRNKLGVKGVYYEKRSNRYFALICKDYKQINLGTYDTIEEASAVYRRAAKKLFGEFARME